MVQVQLQMCINRFDVPCEIQTIIKEYTFYDVERAKVRKMKEKIHTSINISFCTSKESEHYPYWFSYNKMSYCFCTFGELTSVKCNFCKCGDYKRLCRKCI